MALRRQWGDDRGAAMAVELIWCVPLLVGFVVVCAFAGRIWFAHQALQSAATDAARAASIARSASAARSQANEWATTSLANQGLHCVRTQIQVETSGFARPVGIPADVQVRIGCDLNTADLTFPGIPGSVALEAVMNSPLDTYRARR